VVFSWKYPCSDSQPLPVPCATIPDGLWHPSVPCSPLPMGCASPAQVRWHPPVGWGDRDALRSAARPGRAMKRGRGPGEDWGAPGLCAAHEGQGEGMGQEGEGDVVSLAMAGGSCSSLCHPAPYRHAMAGYGDALYLAAEAKPCVRIKAQSSNRQESIDTSLL